MKLVDRCRHTQEEKAAKPGFLRVRFAVNVVFLVVAFLLFPFADMDFVVHPLLLLCFVGLAGNLISFLWLLSGKHVQYHIHFVAFVDVVLITIAVHYLGGIESTFSGLYIVVLVAAALTHGPRMGIYVAAVSSILFSGLLIAEFAGIIPHVDLSEINAVFVHSDRSHLYARLFSTYVIFSATTAVSGYFAHRLFRNKADLEEMVEERTGELLQANKQLSEEISDRKNVEETLEKSVALIRATLESTPNGIMVVDVRGKVQFYNQKFLEMWCIPEQILKSNDDLEMPRHMLNQAKHPKQVVESAKELFAHPEKEHFHILELNDGRVFERSSNPQKIGDETVGIVVSYRDVRERNLAEELLRKSEQKYRTLFEESKDAIFISTPEGRILDINLSGVQLFGYSSKEEFLHIGVADTYLNIEDRDKYRAAMARQGFVKDMELIPKTKSGEELNVLVTANAVRDEAGHIVAYRGIMRDITEQKHLEQQFFQAQKMESIGTLAGGIAHDFNNLLGGILGYASFMKSKMEPDHPFYQYVDIMERSSMRAAELTSQLLGFARGGKYDVKSVNVNNIIGETVKLVERTFDKSVEIETRLTESLPTVMADSGQLQQMLMNLFVNAADAMPAGGKLAIETSSQTLTDEYVKTHVGARAGAYACISVMDTGIGMDKETQKRIFEPFFTTKQEGKGTGLGLSMVYGVAKSHGGYITVYSEPACGTTFRVYLPISGEREEAESLKTEAPHGRNELILVVDDEEPIRSFTETVLANNGYRVLLAEDGAQAIDVYKNHDDAIGMVILDMIMPKMGGQQTFLQLLAQDPQVKALLSSGYSQTGKAQEILDSGVLGFIQKPYQAHTLLSKVRDVLDK